MKKQSIVVLAVATIVCGAATADGADRRAGLGVQRVFEGESLREVAFPLGGIGTGTVSLGGRGNLRDWEIFNRPGKGVDLPFTFFALHCEEEGRPASVRVLEGPLLPPLTTGFGFRREYVPGLPRMERARFRGAYPFAEVELEDGRLPVAVVLEAFNPFIPLKPEDSGIPAAVLRFRVRNRSAAPVRVTVLASLLNPVGYDGEGPLTSAGNEKFGRNRNELRRGDGLAGLFMTSDKAPAGAPAAGTVALATSWPDITYAARWERAAWFDDLQILWDDFAADGRLQNTAPGDPSPEGRTDIGSLGLRAAIAPGGEAVLPFVLSWHFPNVLNYFDIVESQRGRLFRNAYAQRFGDAWAAAAYLTRNLDRLEAESRRFHDAFFASTLPPYVLDAVSSQASIIRTTTGLWLDNGRFFAFEGCADQRGCCPLNCAHVWNYAQSLAFLFPSLERSMRETDFLTNVRPDGAMVFRTSLPVENGVFWDFKPAADGQLGRVINLYRDWQISGDTAFLRRLWPQVRKALEYAWTSWDKDKDGLLEGEQHNTYDIEFYGPNSMLSGFYLAALQAGAKMAEAVGDVAAARAFRGVFEKGCRAYDETLWNGSYYVQKYDGVMTTKYQYGEGCLSDQLLGVWLASVAGLERFLPRERIISTLESIFRHNFRSDFRDFSNCQRTYALGDEQGLLLCSWPKGGRPPLPFPYSDEVWTGVEYQVASHLISMRKVEEGLAIVKAVRDRYDGRKRNPWNEVECGHHYARALSSWGVLLALSGYSYSGPESRLGFAPLVSPEAFRCFWSAGTAWGSFEQSLSDAGLTAEVRVLSGTLPLKELGLVADVGVFGADAKPGLKASLTGKPLRAKTEREGNHLVARWPGGVTVAEGQTLRLVWTR
ncbi:MAG: hypothetical protein JW742_02520 [Candidatus Aminicenantes bacterium]|nr:hypothetical protein [Candidatus Aminicenantes bacterium]